LHRASYLAIPGAMPTTSIAAEICTRCGTCVAECPIGAIALPPAPTGVPSAPPTIDARCFGCGHCGAVCVAGAVRSESGDFPQWHAPGLAPEAARAFLTGRRSVRRYQPEPLGADLLEELLSVAPYAPTASHAQDVAASVLTGERVFELATQVNDYYLWFENLLSRAYLRPLLWFTAARPYLKHPEKIEPIRAKAKSFDRDRDWLFFQAPAVVVLTAPRKNKIFGRTNCVIAAERIMQYGFALGVGSCWIGYAEVALRRRRAIAAGLGIDRDRAVHAVFTLGRPVPDYRRLPARRPLPVA
jgi:nitroreductase/NAD-dependent dihydropyrimidine dehydrogenase PreA subunit